jgi:peptidoglycan/LPS O-acetylase OafA/YrhL
MGFLNIKLSYTSRKYVPELDGIRGIAVLAVMFYHCFPSSVTRIGWMGVDLFFVLSGFLITGILLDTRGDKGYYTNFIGRRFLRIFPLYYLVLCIVFFVLPHLLKAVYLPHFDYYKQHEGWFWLYMQNWLYSKDGFPPNHLLVHFWTLGVEEQFYLVWPWLVRFIPHKHLLKTAIFLCIGAILFRLLPSGSIAMEPTYRYMSTLSRMDGLLIGAIIAILIRDNPNLLTKLAIPVLICSVIGLATGIIISRSVKFLDLPPYYTFIDLLSGSLVVIGLSTKKWVKAVVKWPVLISLGKYSYGLYVYHYVIFIMLRYNLNDWLEATFASFLARMLVLGSITMLLAVGVSIASFHLFESRFLKLKRLFAYSRKASDRADSTPVIGKKAVQIPSSVT